MSSPDQAEAFSRLFHDHYRRLLAYALRRTDTNADAQDIVADVFTVAWRRFEELPQNPDQRRMLLYGIARRVVANHHRSRRRAWRLTSRLGQLADEGVSGPNESDHADQAVAIQALARLDPSDQEILLLSVWEEMSHQEIARIVRTSTANVAVRLHRAKQRLRQHFNLLQDAEPAGHVSGVETPGARLDDNR